MVGGKDFWNGSHNCRFDGDATAHIRMDATNKEAITRYFDLTLNK
jgi:hypothetical protein